MQKKRNVIKFSDKLFEYKLIKRKGHKNFSLSVHAGRNIILTVPKYTSNKKAEKFILSKKKWLKKIFENVDYNNFDGEEERKKYKKHKESSRIFVKKRLKELNKIYNFKYKRISIRLNRTRWGSCSSAGNLNFDYRILFLEPELQDYLLVHELCHLREMNHSKEFWKLVEVGVPNYKYLRNKLKEKRLR